VWKKATEQVIPVKNDAQQANVFERGEADVLNRNRIALVKIYQ
jgi:hypothetical protein